MIMLRWQLCAGCSVETLCYHSNVYVRAISTVSCANFDTFAPSSFLVLLHCITLIIILLCCSQMLFDCKAYNVHRRNNTLFIEQCLCVSQSINQSL